MSRGRNGAPQRPMVGPSQDDGGVGAAEGAELEATSRKYGVTATTLSRWREAFLEGGKRQSQEIDSKHIVLSLPIALPPKMPRECSLNPQAWAKLLSHRRPRPPHGIRVPLGRHVRQARPHLQSGPETSTVRPPFQFLVSAELTAPAGSAPLKGWRPARSPMAHRETSTRRPIPMHCSRTSST